MSGVVSVPQRAATCIGNSKTLGQCCSVGEHGWFIISRVHCVDAEVWVMYARQLAELLMMKLIILSLVLTLLLMRLGTLCWQLFFPLSLPAAPSLYLC
jgi:hypothetical protein